MAFSLKRARPLWSIYRAGSGVSGSGWRRFGGSWSAPLGSVWLQDFYGRA